MPRADFRPAKEPVLAAQGHGANLPFQMIRINGHVGIGEKYFQGGFALERVLCRLAKGIRREENFRHHRLFEPDKEVFYPWLAVLPAMRELGLGC